VAARMVRALASHPLATASSPNGRKAGFSAPIALSAQSGECCQAPGYLGGSPSGRLRTIRTIRTGSGGFSLWLIEPFEHPEARLGAACRVKDALSNGAHAEADARCGGTESRRPGLHSAANALTEIARDWCEERQVAWQ
jgi:hypothetical protein